MRLSKFIFLLIYLFTSLTCYSDATDQTSMSLQQYGTNLREGIALSPNCIVDNALSTQLIALGVVGSSLLMAGIQQVFIAAGIFEPFSKAALLTIGLSSIAGAGLIVSTSLYGSSILACMNSFVNNPRDRYPDHLSKSHPDYSNRGKLRKRTNAITAAYATYAPANGVYDADWAPSSDYLYLNMRGPLPTSLGINSSCNGGYALSADWDKYGGEGAVLCAEEWQSLGVNFDLKVTSTNPLIIEKVVKKTTDQSGNVVYDLFDSSRYDDTKRKLKQFTGPMQQVGPFNKNTITSIAGYKYKVSVTGRIIYVYLMGFGDIPLSTPMFIGSHYRKTTSARPQCPAAKPIREDGDWSADDDRIIPGTGSADAAIIDYDNSACVGCNISSSCLGKLDYSMHKAVIPFTSIVYQCIRETVTSTIYGCQAGPGKIAPVSTLAAIQKRLSRLVFTVVSLAFAMFSMSMLMSASGHIAKKDLFAFVFKVAIVLWCTRTSSSGIGGAQQLSMLGQQVTDGILQIITGVMTSTANNLCYYDPTSFLIADPVTGAMKDYRHLLYWVTIDCFFGMSMGLTVAGVDDVKPANVSSGADQTPVLASAMIPKLVLVIMSLILGGPTLWVLFFAMIFFTIMMFLLIVWTLQMIIISFFFYNIYWLFSPIFFAMWFFPTTEQSFQSWVRETTALIFINQPMLSMSLAVYMMCFNKLYWGATVWVPKTVWFGGAKVKHFFVQAGSDCAVIPPTQMMQGSIQCGCDLGAMGCWLSGIALKTKDVAFGVKATGYEVVTYTKTFNDAAMGYLQLAVISYLFYWFVEKMLLPLMVEIGGSRATLEGAGAGISIGDNLRKAATSFLRKGKSGNNKSHGSDGKGGAGGGGGDQRSGSRQSNMLGAGNSSGGASGGTSLSGSSDQGGSFSDELGSGSIDSSNDKLKG